METQEYPLMYKLENHHWWFLAKRKFINSVFPKKKSLEILDVGAGTGGTTEFLKNYGHVIGVELNDAARELAQKRKLEIIKGSAEKLPFCDGKFDAVSFFDVLYHKNIKSDLAALREAYRVLKPTGNLIITDCAFEFLRGPHDDVMQARERYTRKILVERIKKAGFTVEKASHVFFFLFALVVVKRLLDRLKIKLAPNSQESSDVSETPEPLNAAFLLICQLEAFLLKYVNLPWGSSIIIRARK